MPKTTKEIINDELGVILNSVDYDVNNALFEINKNKKWYSEEEVKHERLEALRDLRDDLQRDIKNLYEKYTKNLHLLVYAGIAKKGDD